MNKFFISLLFFLASSLAIHAQSNDASTQENSANREWFRDAKFGMFIHWGLYSMLGSGEWVLNSKELKDQEYQKLASAFYPAHFDAAAWVSAAKNAGAKYITFTSRHHDGFSMFDTRFSDYNIVKATSYGKDIVKQLAEECKKQDIKLFLYYSLLDWHRPDYYPLGNTGKNTGRTQQGEWTEYIAFMKNQLTEILTNYGPIGGIWFDGWWDKEDANWHLDEIYALIHQLQPGCLIGNNHHHNTFPGEDFQMFERDLPGENTVGYSAQDISSLPLETCETMNESWGYRITDENYKSTKAIIHYLVKAAGRNANLLMNVGPQPNGEIPATSLERLKEVGEWTKKYGETIYGTRGGSVTPRNWGVTTEKANKMYIHILNLPDKAVYLPINGKKVKKAVTYKDRTAVKFSQDKEGVLLNLKEIPTDIDYIVELTF